MGLLDPKWDKESQAISLPDTDGQPRFAFDGPEAYARLPLGAVILGGLPLAG